VKLVFNATLNQIIEALALAVNASNAGPLRSFEYNPNDVFMAKFCF